MITRRPPCLAPCVAPAPFLTLKSPPGPLGSSSSLSPASHSPAHPASRGHLGPVLCLVQMGLDSLPEWPWQEGAASRPRTPQPWTCWGSALLSRHRGQAGAPRLRSLPCPAWVCSSSHSPVKPFPWHCGTRPSELKKDFGSCSH